MAPAASVSALGNFLSLSANTAPSATTQMRPEKIPSARNSFLPRGRFSFILLQTLVIIGIAPRPVRVEPSGSSLNRFLRILGAGRGNRQARPDKPQGIYTVRVALFGLGAGT